MLREFHLIVILARFYGIIGRLRQLKEEVLVCHIEVNSIDFVFIIEIVNAQIYFFFFLILSQPCICEMGFSFELVEEIWSYQVKATISDELILDVFVLAENVDCFNLSRTIFNTMNLVFFFEN